MPRCLSSLLWATIVLVLLNGTAKAGERCYVLVFGSQRSPTETKYTHSFATFVRFVDSGPRPEDACLEAFTISWLPSTLEIRVRAPLAEPGVNLPLHETLEYIHDNKERVSLWGPYEICPDMYRRAVEHAELLESGRIRYKAVDSLRRTSRVSNCIHALGSVADGYRMRVFSPSWGETASYYVARRYRRWLIDPECTHDWLIGCLGLDDYPLTRREYREHPRSGVFWGLLLRPFRREP